MEIQYDPAKARTNARKHQVSFEESATSFIDDRALSKEDSSAIDENRWALIGMSNKARVLTVVYTHRQGILRIISARKASKREIEDYARRI